MANCKCLNAWQEHMAQRAVGFLSFVTGVSVFSSSPTGYQVSNYSCWLGFWWVFWTLSLGGTVCALFALFYLLVPGGVSWFLMIPPQGGTLCSLLFVTNLSSSQGMEISSHINSLLEPHTRTLYSQLLLLLLILTVPTAGEPWKISCIIFSSLPVLMDLST